MPGYEWENGGFPWGHPLSLQSLWLSRRFPFLPAFLLHRPQGPGQRYRPCMTHSCCHPYRGGFFCPVPYMSGQEAHTLFFHSRLLWKSHSDGRRSGQTARASCRPPPWNSLSPCFLPAFLPGARQVSWLWWVRSDGPARPALPPS